MENGVIIHFDAFFDNNSLPNQKFSWEHSRIKVGRPAMPRQIFVGLTHSLSWAYVWHMSRLLREASHNAAHNI